MAINVPVPADVGVKELMIGVEVMDSEPRIYSVPVCPFKVSVFAVVFSVAFPSVQLSVALLAL